MLTCLVCSEIFISLMASCILVTEIEVAKSLDDTLSEVAQIYRRSYVEIARPPEFKWILYCDKKFRVDRWNFTCDAYLGKLKVVICNREPVRVFKFFLNENVSALFYHGIH